MITREKLTAEPEALFGLLSEGRYLTDSERRTSLADALKSRPEGKPFLIFAYGSLIWNPVLSFVECQRGNLKNWRRAFCMTLSTGRATPDQPGRMLALLPGTGTEGLVYELPENELEDELMLLWKREMSTTSYEPRWEEVVLESGVTVIALVFVMSREDITYNSDFESEEVVRAIARAKGPLGSNAEYLHLLSRALKDYALTDPYVQHLAAKVNAAVHK